MNDYPLLIGGVGLIRGRIKNFGGAMVRACDDIKPIFANTNAFEGMPFEQINMVIRWGHEEITDPEIGPLKKKEKVINVATTIALSDGKAVENDDEELVMFVKTQVEKVLAGLHAKYGMRQIDI